MHKSITNFICLFLLCFVHAEVKSDSESAFSRNYEILFQEAPLRVEEITDSDCLTVRVYDPADSVLAPLGSPFMEIEITFNEEGAIEAADLSEIGRTDSLNGAQLIEIVKYLQLYYCIPKIEVIDLAMTLPCPLNGFLCHDEALHPLSLITIYLSGKGFYERGGAIPIPTDGRGEAYRTAADFIYLGLRIDHFVKDLQSIQGLFPKASILTNFIEKAVIATQSSTTDRLSELFQRVRTQSNQDKAAHQMWHEMLNRFVGMEDHFLLEFSDYVLTHQANYPKAVSYFCAHAVVDYVDQAISMFEDEDLGLEFNSNQEKREYFFDHQKEVLELIGDLVKRNEDNEEDKGILDLTYQYRINHQTLLNTMKIYMPDIDHLRKIYQNAKSFLKAERIDNNEEGCDDDSDEDEMLLGNEKLWIELADWIKDASATEENPEGYLYLMWHAARRMIKNLNIFEFIHPDYNGSSLF